MVVVPVSLEDTSNDVVVTIKQFKNAFSLMTPLTLFSALLPAK